jgi:hypothetical protein
MDLWGLGGVPNMVLEVCRCPWIKGFRSDGHSELSNTIYLDQTLFLVPPNIVTIFFSLFVATKRGKDSSTLTRKKKGQGAAAALGRHFHSLLGAAPIYQQLHQALDNHIHV